MSPLKLFDSGSPFFFVAPPSAAFQGLAPEDGFAADLLPEAVRAISTMAGRE